MSDISPIIIAVCGCGLGILFMALLVMSQFMGGSFIVLLPMMGDVFKLVFGERDKDAEANKELVAHAYTVRDRVRNTAANLYSRVKSADFDGLVDKYRRMPDAKEPHITETDREMQVHMPSVDSPIKGRAGSSFIGRMFGGRRPRVRGPKSVDMSPIDVRDYDNDGEHDVV